MDILGIIGILLGILTVILFIVKKFNIIVATPNRNNRCITFQ